MCLLSPIFLMAVNTVNTLSANTRNCLTARIMENAFLSTYIFFLMYIFKVSLLPRNVNWFTFLQFLGVFLRTVYYLIYGKKLYDSHKWNFVSSTQIYNVLLDFRLIKVHSSLFRNLVELDDQIKCCVR